MFSNFKLPRASKSAFVPWRGRSQSSNKFDINHNLKFSFDMYTFQDHKYELVDLSNLNQRNIESKDTMIQLKTNSSLRSFKKKMYQISIMWDNNELAFDLG